MAEHVSHSLMHNRFADGKFDCGYDLEIDSNMMMRKKRDKL